jgi:hypothetical protein
VEPYAEGRILNPFGARSVRYAGLLIQSRCKQNSRSADSVRVRDGSMRQRGSEPELCSVVGIPVMVDRREKVPPCDSGS